MGILVVTKNGDLIEQIRPGASAAGVKVAPFDFDGTISIIRSGWIDVMALIESRGSCQ
jgi:hypothetical protein